MTLVGSSYAASLPAGVPNPYRNPVSALIHIGRSEGVRGLQRGLGPACLWQFSNVSVRFGVYSAAKTVTGIGDSSASPFVKWVKSLGLAAVSGGFAALASNPFFIVKTRFQAEEAPSVGAAGELMSILRVDGPAGLFRGLSAFAPRVIVASAVQLSTYDAIKAAVVQRTGLHRDSLGTVLASSFLTGIAVVLAMQPFDFAATRLVNSRSVAESGGAALYKGPFDVMRQTIRDEGLSGLYRGGTANYLRFGPYCVLVFVFVEQLRKVEQMLFKPDHR
mmetsp:Transcript_2537/g.7326  ORF Transcript_2537/g.7326 Transcript_2537/m.7326 type:complete len:276 (+) Transcript_2537:3-830(+)